MTSISEDVQVTSQAVVVAQTLISGEANIEAELTAASGTVTVFAEEAPTPTVRVAAAPGLSHVTRLQSQVAADTVTERTS